MTDLATLLEVGGPVAALGGGAAYARANHPGLYWSTVGLPISTARLLSSYSSVMEACGLTVAPSRLRVLAVKATTRREVRPVPPRRGIVRPTSTGLRLRLRLAPGQEPADVAASAERLRHAWGVHAVYVTTIKPGVVELRLVGFDVLRKVRMPRKAAEGFLKVPVALREDATPLVRDYRTVPHGLTLGATLSGKSMYLRHLVAGLARQPVALVGIDCKRGVELAPFAPRLSALATDPDAIQAATAAVRVDGPVIDGRAHVFTFGRQLDVRTIRSADFDGGQELTERAVAAYIAKYATKGAETATGALDRPLKFVAELAQFDISEHACRLIRTAWALGARKDLEHLRLRAWAHMLGFRGHFSTKSRRYSTTLGALRTARAEWRRAQAAETHTDPDTTLVLAHWVYAGTGLTNAEAWLAESLEPAPGTEGEPTWTTVATS